MKLVLSENNLPIKRELELIFNLFKEKDDELIFLKDKENIQLDSLFVNLAYDYKDSEVYATLTYEAKGKKIEIIESKLVENDIKSSTKHVINVVWLKFLQNITGKRHDWGILTGIRPTKLYHNLLFKYTHDEVDNILQNDYLLSEKKTSILNTITKRQLDVIPDLYKIDNEVSLYIGIPFCPTKCAYCTFPAYSIEGFKTKVDPFINALKYEISHIGDWIKRNNKKVTTIYFGGGTPTSISKEQINDILFSISKSINLEEVREVTIEAGRPDTITSEKLDVLNKWNIDRISINPQTFTQETLNIIGRDHTVEETIIKYNLAKEKGITNINMDLIIGLPGESLINFKDSLDNINKLLPESLTIHTLALKKSSYLTKKREEFNLSAYEEIEKMMEYAYHWTAINNYLPYYLYRQKNMLGNLENIGYSKIGKESLYNIIIMEEKQTIIGLGSGAVSKFKSPNSDKLTRYPNPKEPKAYIEKVEKITRDKIQNLNEIFSILT